MKKTVLKLTIMSLLAIAIEGLPGYAHAQDTKTPAAEKKETRKPGVVPFHGKLKGVDATARTLAVGELTIRINAETKISKAGQPAALEDGVVGEDVSGAYRKSAAGELDATTVRFGPKPDKSEPGKDHPERTQ
jgi:hypothetical protein